MKENSLPRVLSLVVLLVSVILLIPLGFAVAAMLRGQPVTTASWSVPLIMLGTGAALTWLLARKGVAVQLFISAMALWLLAAGYFFYTR